MDGMLCCHSTRRWLLFRHPVKRNEWSTDSVPPFLTEPSCCAPATTGSATHRGRNQNSEPSSAHPVGENVRVQARPPEKGRCDGASSNASHTCGSSVQRHWTCGFVRCRPGISRYSARWRSSGATSTSSSGRSGSSDRRGKGTSRRRKVADCGTSPHHATRGGAAR